MADDQNTTDIKEYLYLQGSSTDDGRDWDHEVRGLGATKEIPTCTVGQENVLRRPYPEDKYYKQSILIHELGHSVMEVHPRGSVFYFSFVFHFHHLVLTDCI